VERAVFYKSWFIPMQESKRSDAFLAGRCDGNVKAVFPKEDFVRNGVIETVQPGDYVAIKVSLFIKEKSIDWNFVFISKKKLYCLIAISPYKIPSSPTPYIGSRCDFTSAQGKMPVQNDSVRVLRSN